MTISREDGQHLEVVVNEHAPMAIPGVRTDRGPLGYHRLLPGYERTPLVDCPTLAAKLGLGHVWVKDETWRIGLPSFKMLGASYAVYRALYERLGVEPDWSGLDALSERLDRVDPLILSAATDGNHGRAVARMARILGLDCCIYVPDNMVSARIEAIEGEGASVVIVDGGYDDAISRSAKDLDRGWVVVSDTSWPDYERIPNWVIEGYSTMFWEIDDELEESGAAPIDVALIPVGVGALAAAAVHHFCHEGVRRQTRLISVEPLAADCMLESVRAGEPVMLAGPQDSIMAGLNCGAPSLLAWPLVSRGFSEFVAIEDERARQGMRELAGVGIVAGECGGSSLGALFGILDGPDADVWRRDRGLGPNASVLLICTEGATDPRGYEEIVGRAPTQRI